MRRSAKLVLLLVFKITGVFALFNLFHRHSLRILCYHGFSLDDEHRFRPKLLMSPADFERRVVWLKRRGYRIIPLDRAIDEFVDGRLPPKTVVITMDDGYYSVYSRAGPIVRKLGAPATVYITTYYVTHPEPVYSVLLPYLLWKGNVAEIVLPQGRFDGLGLAKYAARLNAEERRELIRDVAERMHVDLAPIMARRSLHLMEPEEIAELAQYGVDVQLHTHRHRWSMTDTSINGRELVDNAAILAPLAAHPLVHFCYPSGVNNPAQLGWMNSVGLKSAVTLEHGLNRTGASRFGLRRILDGSDVSLLEFEARLCGLIEFMRRIKTFLTGRAYVSGLTESNLWEDDGSPQEVVRAAEAVAVAKAETAETAIKAGRFHATHYLLRGSAWFVAVRWVIRGIGFISTIILARILTPHDFGLYTMAFLVVGFVEIFSDSGQRLALIRHPNPTREHYDTAWTIGICVGIVVALVVAASAPLANVLFREPRAVPMVLAMSLRPLIVGFENIGIIDFRRNFDFQSDFIYLIMCKLLPFFILLGAAFTLRNYWAFPIGMVGGRCLSTLFSYWISSYRPRLSLSKIGELWNFSWWTVVGSAADQLASRFDEFVVGRLFGTHSMGLYNVAFDLAYSPTDEVIGPVSRSMFAVYSKMSHDYEGLAAHFRQVLSAFATIAMATGIGVALIAYDMVPVLLGPQWVEAAPLVASLAFAASVEPVLNSMLVVLNVTGHARRTAYLTWSKILLLAAVLPVLGYFLGIEAIAWGRCAVIVLVAPIFILGLSRTVPIGLGQIAAQFWRPMIASLCMALAVISLRPYLDVAPVIRMVVSMVVGAAVYAAALVCLWWLAGRPRGFEMKALETIQSFLWTGARFAWIRRQ